MTHPNVPSDDDLQRRLRDLPRAMTPPDRVWEAVAQGIAVEPRAAGAHTGMHTGAPSLSEAATARQRRRRRWGGVGMAMAAVLAVVAVLPMLHTPGADPVLTPAEAQAEAIAAEYGNAIAALPDARASDELRPALDELDRSVEAIHAAIAESPDAGFLVGQLRRAYDQRLELTRLASLDGAFNIAPRTSP
ncbi:hypothetical protein [Luteimonas abyssi]|uniref:hypothetical protein n=1 Tax=Luteimonas abyssi TaxID=1247514 RepID=UPI000737BBEE|nr:hypothetical protein [Luteimonas abyssi]